MASPIAWRLATIGAVQDETPTVRSFTLAIPDWAGHRAGQHVDLRLTAEDGYSVERSYSIASEPERAGEIELTVERIADGEVSPFLHDVAVPGDRIEVRGPIGGYFVWGAAGPMASEPLFLVAGGSGVVPLMAMLRHRARVGVRNPCRLLFSSRYFDEVIYREELDRLAAAGDGFDVVHTLTRSRPPDWTGYARRIDDPDDRRGRRSPRVRGPRVHLRPDGPRRGRGERVGPPGAAGRSGPDRAIRADGHVTENRPMDDDTTTTGDPIADAILDGNSVAGVLAAAFGAEMTAVPGECAHCGTVNVLAAMRAYVRAPGTVLRCPACDGVVVRIVQTPTAILVDVRGAAWLRFDRG
jgi:ferredoxin-NADP reductase